MNLSGIELLYGVLYHPMVRDAAIGVLAGFILSLTPGCGARSSFADPEPCYQLGATRKCQNLCGIGQQQCQAGFWQPCKVATQVQTCSNNCGSGTRSCDDGAWSECKVQQTTRDCSNTCGAGTQICADNVWQTCAVPETSQACENACGSGVQVCSNNTWSECNVPHQEQACSSVCGTGKRTCDGGQWSVCDAPQPQPPKLHGIVRDFRSGQPPDFGHPEVTDSIDDRGFVGSILGADDTPTYALSGPSLTVQGAQTFDEWFHDVPGVNQSTSLDLPLVAASDGSGLFAYVNHSFFPIDGQLFGDEGWPHNYNFTFATSATFTYQGNEIFRFTGDDDVFVFINRHLAIDLGGVHNAETELVDLAARAQEFEIVPGNRYSIHIFFAERHPTQSDFAVETSIADIGACP